MADAPNSPPWGDDWIEANRQYWDAWTRAWRPPAEQPTPAAGPPPGLPWADIADRWWKLMMPPAPPSSRQVLDQLVEQGKTFLQFGEDLTSSLARTGGFQSPDDWQRALKAIADSWQAGFAQPPGAAGLAAFWKLPLDTWSRTASSASVFPGDFLESHKPEAWGRFADGLHRDLERFLSVPALGYTREVQEQGQDLVRLTLEYQRAFQAYAMTFQDLATGTVDRLQRRLADRAKRREPVTSLRGLYDLWVDSSEEAYFELVATDAYAEVYGRMVNALMALKNHGRNMVDEVVGAFGLPTRHGLGTLQQRQQELRREVVALRRELSEIRSARSELADLRREVDGLKSRGTRGGPAAGPRRRAKASRHHTDER
jgi:class III poly(R)-hydroxyalkanoic acid synthase PhaE subunit